MPLAPLIEYDFFPFTISGNAGTPGATITYTGPSSGMVTADGSGNYTIYWLAAGTYTVTPTKAGFTFTPTSRSVTITTASVSGVNFSASSGPVGGSSLYPTYIQGISRQTNHLSHL